MVVRTRSLGSRPPSLRRRCSVAAFACVSGAVVLLVGSLRAEELVDESDSWLLLAEETADPPVPENFHDVAFGHGNLDGRGLLDFQDSFPLALLHLQMPLSTPGTIEPGKTRGAVDFFWGSSTGVDRTRIYAVDAETYKLSFGAWHALRSDVYVGAELSVMARGRGILDPVITDFHQITGAGAGDTARVSPNSYDVFVTDNRGRRHELDQGFGLGDLNLKALWIINEGDRWLPSVSSQIFLALPTSSTGFGTDGLDLGIALTASKQILEFFYLHFTLAGTYLTDPEVEGAEFRQTNFAAAVGGEIVVLRSLSLIIQAMRYSPLLDDTPKLDDARKYIAGGFKWALNDTVVFEFTAIENFDNFENSSDIVFVLGVEFDI